MRKNKLSISSTGGGPSQFCPLSAMEEQVVNLLHMEEAVNGLPKATCFGISGDNSSHITIVNNNDLTEKTSEATQIQNNNLDENLRATKRPRLSNFNERDNLLKTQVQNQGMFQKETANVLDGIRKDLKDLVRYHRKTFELKEKKMDFCKDKFNFKKECKLQKQKLELEKLELKKQILQLEIEKAGM